MGSLINWLTKKKEPELDVYDPTPLAKPGTWIEDYGMSYIPPDLQEKMEEARRKLAEKEEARRREDAFPYHYGGWSGGITHITPTRSPLGEIIGSSSPMISKSKMDAIYEALNGISRVPRENKKPCTIPGCKIGGKNHNDYGDYICEDHYKTWKENNA